MNTEIRPFNDQSASYTLREIHAPDTEFKSIYPDADAAAVAFLRACREARTAVLRDPAGTVIAVFSHGCKTAAA